jgi:uracil-DNA glycosylase
MILTELWDFFEQELFPIRPTKLLFNQYKDIDPRVDLPNANGIRRKNLRSYIESFSNKPPILILGEAPGPWGCRFSGVPFTGERQLLDPEFFIHGNQSSRFNPMYKKRNKSPPYISNSSHTFWQTLEPFKEQFFVWNCIPFHPYKEGDILSIRNPNNMELQKYLKIIKTIISILDPEKIISVGRKPEKSLNHISKKSEYVRHPARGGAQLFQESITKLFKKKNKIT